LIVVVDDKTNPDSTQARQALRQVWRRLNGLRLRLPKSWGIFSQAINANALTQPESLGDINESRDIFGKRIQLLLDCQPVYTARSNDGSTAFDLLLTRILDWYATAFVNAHEDKQWTYLINDLIRYFRSYAAWHQFKTTVEHDDSWYIRNAKLRTSRMMMYAGLLLLLGESSRVGFGKPAWLLKHLKMTPLERVLYSCRHGGISPADSYELVHCYNGYFDVMNSAEAREALVADAPTSIDALPPSSIAAYEPIAKQSAKLQSLLTRYTLARAANWHPRFVDYLIY
jgi:hypothetical protein